jgi:hypothetical protein
VCPAERLRVIAQRVSHFGFGADVLCKKALLAGVLQSLHAQHKQLRRFHPQTFRMPEQRVEALAALKADAKKRQNTQDDDDGGIAWICKPSRSSRGRLITLHSTASLLQHEEKFGGAPPSLQQHDDHKDAKKEFVLQRYLRNACLLQMPLQAKSGGRGDTAMMAGRKFDFRLYVLVSQFHPKPIVHVHCEGIARFCSELYSNKTQQQQQQHQQQQQQQLLYSHLTNYSINKRNVKQQVLLKWPVSRVMAALDEQHGAGTSSVIWIEIRRIVCVTVLAVARQAPANARAFELYGFDVMLDAALKPWLLEVNVSPGLAVTSECDRAVKTRVLLDLCHILRLPGFEAAKHKDAQENGFSLVYPLGDDESVDDEHAALCRAILSVSVGV